MESNHIVIIGAGIGGLATANLLAAAGHSVTVYEQASTAGGRAGRLDVDGYRFDTGPSWYLMPKVFEHYFQLLDEPISKWLDLKKLTPAYKVFFENDEPVVITGTLAKDRKTFEAIEPGAGQALERYIEKSNIIYQLSLRHFLYSNFERFSDVINKQVLSKALWLPRLLLKPIDTYVSGFVRDYRLKQILEYPMVFLGTSPFNAPAMYSLMSALDFEEGVFYPQGGMYKIIESLQQIGSKLGVKYKFNHTVGQIIVQEGRASGIQLVDGETVTADTVISNADLHFTETALLAPEHQSYPEKYWASRQAGPSALLLYLGVNGKIPELEHHNLVFVKDWRANFSSIYETKTIPDQASIYISKTSQTDPTVAPAGNENLFVLVPLPAGRTYTKQETANMTDHYISQIEGMTNISIADRIAVQQIFTPQDFETQFNSWQSSMLGQSHLLKQSAFFRTPNKSKRVNNLYYVGGNTTPGIGLPMCLIGAELVYKRIIGDKRGGKVEQIHKVRLK